MADVILIILAVIVVLISIWFLKGRNGKKRLPGPIGLPIVGYIPFLTWRPFVKFTELSKYYGPIYSIRLGSKDVVIITDFQITKKAFMDDDFFCRPELVFEMSEKTMQTGAMLGYAWKEQRRFCLHVLRDLGFGKTRMEGHIKEEILELLNRISGDVHSPIYLSDFLVSSMSNNVASVIFGKRLKHDDPERQRLDHIINEISRTAASASAQMAFPWIGAILRYFKIGSGGDFSNALREAREYFQKQISEHKSTLDVDNLRDFIDNYLLEIKKRSSDPNSSFHVDVLADLARGFFGAGSETVRVTVEWIILTCASYPEVQKKIYAEIEKTLGTDMFPSWQDRFNMPYTEATMWEVMRWKTIVPLNLLRYTYKDTELDGFIIPKHSTILSVTWSIDHDQKLWGEDADAFRPERFLSEDGTKVVRPEHFIPFSIGKRSCPGKSLAEIEVFMYVVAILQKFEASIPEGKTASFEEEMAISLKPKRQEICLKLR